MNDSKHVSVRETPKFVGLKNIGEQLLTQIGEKPTRDGLLKTPARFAKAIMELTSGYNVDIKRLINDAHFVTNAKEMVVVRNIPFFSVCEHHMLPFFGCAHVAYVPRKRVIGLSKIPRIVDVFARRLQIQEQMTYQIAEVLQDNLKPLGVAVVTEARHLCMEMRGVERIGSSTVASEMTGCFKNDPRTRAEFLEHLQRKTSF